MPGNRSLKWYDLTAYIILIIAGINTGLTIFDFNLIEKIISLFFPSYTVTFAYIKTIIYLIIGLAGIYSIYLAYKLTKNKL